MPHLHNGTGTKYFGKRDVDIRGTYVTTEWLTVWQLPILPIRSLRVYPMTEQLVTGHGTEQHFHAERVPLNWRQILNIYAVEVTCLAIAWVLFKRYMS
ncbi:hypothetical protein [Mitsuaria sp. 7]|uniref:hypothetical protein n=1 Tax=Mitsuaria sp. 7 TaxID=1658665 RepID=UPI0007DDCFE4|nr:hypothetical protein [Mitsuaria sp. 7]ANH67749.1 hypothetical protein ABE85_09490 [Mitsuaria sp. 7]